MIGMPTISVNEKSKKYLEKLRKIVSKPEERIPSMAQLMERILSFIEKKEREFLEHKE